jgi:hypothetical protein
VRSEPGKNVCWEKIPSSLQPTRRRIARTSRILSMNSLLTGEEDGEKSLRKFPAHPRESQVKTPQEITRWKD